MKIIKLFSSFKTRLPSFLVFCFCLSNSISHLCKSTTHYYSFQRMIDLLKIDVEASEWESLPQMVKNNFLGNTVKQLVIELHFYNPNDKNEALARNCLSALRGLNDAGFLVFSRERNTFCPQCTKHSPLLNLDVSYVTEFSFLNERFLP